MIKKLFFNIRSLFLSFKERDGNFIFISMLISKLVTFITSILVVRILEKESYGAAAYARSIMQILIPFVGFGLTHSFLLYASQSKDDNEKEFLYNNTLRFGFLFTLLLVLISNLVINIVDLKVEGIRVHLHIQSLSLMSVFLFQLTQNKLRVLKKNKEYSVSLNIYSGSMLIITLILSYFGGGKGYSYSFIFVALLGYIIVISKNYKSGYTKNEYKFHLPKYVRYGLYVGIGSILSMLLYSMDIIMIEQMLMDPTYIALYKVGTIIPINLMFIPQVLLLTDFVFLAEDRKNKSKLIKQFKQYFSFLFPLSLFIAVLLIIIGQKVLVLLFGAEYGSSYLITCILAIGMIFSFSLKIPLGNILNAVGYAKYNIINTLITLGVNITLNFILINKYEIIGAAIATASGNLLSGLISLLLFVIYIRRIK